MIFPGYTFEVERLLKMTNQKLDTISSKLTSIISQLEELQDTVADDDEVIISKLNQLITETRNLQNELSDVGYQEDSFED